MEKDEEENVHSKTAETFSKRIITKVVKAWIIHCLNLFRLGFVNEKGKLKIKKYKGKKTIPDEAMMNPKLIPIAKCLT